MALKELKALKKPVFVLIKENALLKSGKGIKTHYMFLGKVSKIDGVALEPVAQARNRAITVLFNQGVLHKTNDKMRAYWSRMMFSGKASPPPELEDGQAAKLHVAKNGAAISYIKKSLLDDTVRSILDVEILAE